MTAPKLARTLADGTRRYVHPRTGEVAYSVTTIIKGGVPQPWMGPWAAKMAAEHACANWLRLSKLPHNQRIAEMKNAHVQYAEKAAKLGDIVHSLVECWMTGQAFGETPKEISGYVNNFIDFLHSERPEFIENECTVWSRTHGYAGTADFIVRVKGKTLVADLKSGRELHPEIGMQLSALAHADFILREDGTEEPLPEIQGLAGLHVRPRGWKFPEIQESEACFKAFLAAKRVMEWAQDTAPKVLGN